MEAKLCLGETALSKKQSRKRWIKDDLDNWLKGSVQHCCESGMVRCRAVSPHPPDKNIRWIQSDWIKTMLPGT